MLGVTLRRYSLGTIAAADASFNFARSASVKTVAFSGGEMVVVEPLSHPTKSRVIPTKIDLKDQHTITSQD